MGVGCVSALVQWVALLSVLLGLVLVVRLLLGTER
jgi:hypothetical protein